MFPKFMVMLRAVFLCLMASFFRREQVAIDERGRLALRRLDPALPAVLGDGTGALLPPLLPCCDFQLDANR